MAQPIREIEIHSKKNAGGREAARSID